jgi:hypothetical protein
MAMFRDAWDLQARSVDDRATQLRKNLHAITTQTDQLVDRITQTGVLAVVATYERRIPCRLWISGSIQNKRLVAKLVFAGRVAYSRSEGLEPLIFLTFRWQGATTDALKLASPNGEISKGWT